MDISKLASLARIKLDEEEKAHLSTEIGAILEYVNQIQNVHVEHIESKDVAPLNVLREDTEFNQSGHLTSKLLALSPDRDGDYIKVKKIL